MVHKPYKLTVRRNNECTFDNCKVVANELYMIADMIMEGYTGSNRGTVWNLSFKEV